MYLLVQRKCFIMLNVYKSHKNSAQQWLSTFFKYHWFWKCFLHSQEIFYKELSVMNQKVAPRLIFFFFIIKKLMETTCQVKLKYIALSYYASWQWVAKS